MTSNQKVWKLEEMSLSSQPPYTAIILSLLMVCLSGLHAVKYKSAEEGPANFHLAMYLLWKLLPLYAFIISLPYCYLNPLQIAFTFCIFLKHLNFFIVLSHL